MERTPTDDRENRRGEGDVRQKFTDRLITSYRRYFDILTPDMLPEPEEPLPDDLQASLAARCDFEVKNAQYVLSKKHELWSAMSHEYCYIFSVKRLTEEDYVRLQSWVYTEGMKLIHPGKGHMSSVLTLIIVCGSADKEAEKLLKKCRLHKSFRFSFDGWMDFHTAMAVLEERRAVTNYSGHDNRRLLTQLLKGF